MLELKKVTKIYGMGSNTFQALKGVDLNIGKGEFVAIMGPSGSGKSTMMNILGALDRPSSGDYILNQQNINDLSDSELAQFRNKTVGFIFQQFNLLQKTSVYDNVALPGLYGNLNDLGTRVENVLTQVGLADKMKNKPNQLSGGQMQRVAIARALLMQPSIVMADEPTGNLDSKTAYEIMELIEEIHAQGNTIILVTHEHDIAAFAHRIIHLKDGEIEKDDKNKKVKSTKKIDKIKI